MRPFGTRPRLQRLANVPIGFSLHPMSSRRRPILIAVAVMAVVWALALAGMALARHLKVTPEKVQAYLVGLNFATLSVEQRRAVLLRLAAMMNALSPEERRAVRMNPEFAKLFRVLNAAEKVEFLELTLPAGFGQMLTAFEQMPADKRRKAIEDTLRGMREQSASLDAGDFSGDAGAKGPDLSPELRDKMVKLGVKTFMEQGTPETKAELQPVLEEMQRNMEAGRMFRPGRRPRNE